MVTISFQSDIILIVSEADYNGENFKLLFAVQSLNQKINNKKHNFKKRENIPEIYVGEKK